MKIHHPGYGPSGLAQAKNDFVFSDDLQKWIGKTQRQQRERDKERQKKNYYKRKNG